MKDKKKIKEKYLMINFIFEKKVLCLSALFDLTS